MGLFGCCCAAIEEAAQEVQLTAAAVRAPPPIELEHGYANEEGAQRGMAPPRCGAFEVVNKNKTGEIIAVLVGENATDIALRTRDPNGYLQQHVNLMVRHRPGLKRPKQRQARRSRAIPPCPARSPT